MTDRSFFSNPAPILVLALLANCGAHNQANNQSNGEAVVENATLTKLSLTSDAFQEGRPIPIQYTCDGANQSPPLKWSEPPQATKSFTIVVDDPDAPSGTFGHWGAFDIPPSTRSLPAGQSQGSHAVNGFGKTGYGGPCPPRGHGAHHYRFKIYALDIDRLPLPSNPKVVDVESAAKQHVVAQGELVGTFERK